MAKQAITLKIAGKSYPFNIESGKEEMYRLAEREVNSYLALIKQQNIKNWNDQDYLSMTALKFAIANVGMRACSWSGTFHAGSRSTASGDGYDERTAQEERRETENSNHRNGERIRTWYC